MRIKHTKLYTFDELDDDAKEKAREWWRSAQDTFDLDHVVDTFAEELEAVGFIFDVHLVRLMGGGVRNERSIDWSGFYSQGDGASFSGHVDFGRKREFMVKQLGVRDTFALDNAEDFTLDLYRISSRYSHAMTMGAEVDYGGDIDAESFDFSALQNALQEWGREKAQDLYSSLQREYEWQMADEQVDEIIIANGYEFDAEGNIG